MTGTWWELMISLEKPKLTLRTVSTANTEPRVVSHAPTQCKDHTICLTQVALANMKAKTKKKQYFNLFIFNRCTALHHKLYYKFNQMKAFS